MGDDLGSDDEYINTKWMTERHSDDDKSISVDNQGDDIKVKKSNNKTGIKTKKRKKTVAIETHRTDDDNDDTSIDQKTESSSNKRIKIKSKNQLLLETGRQIAHESTEIQAAFLWTCFTHYLQLNNHPTTDISSYRKFTSSDFIPTVPTASFVEKLKTNVSVKRMKKWKIMQCPLVLIVCSSARRAVAVLKEIESLHVRIAKLFAKHMDVEDQINLLQEKSHAIAVGTPNRLLKLYESGTPQHHDAKEKKLTPSISVASLHLHQTQLIVIDSWEDSKRFTVCTLNDTAPDLMKLFMNAIIPEIQQRSSIKIAFF